MIVFKYILVILVGYLLGSYSLAIGITSGSGKDIREQGSGNSGATNMARMYGWKAGALTLGADMVKACLAMLLGSALLGDWGVMAAGIASIVGHCYPVFYKFKGGKGISVGAAIGLMIDWRVFVIIIAVFIVFALSSKKVSLGSVMASIAITAASFLLGVSTPKLILAAVAMVIAIFRHSPNIKRLAEGKEKDFKFGKERKIGE